MMAKDELSSLLPALGLSRRASIKELVGEIICIHIYIYTHVYIHMHIHICIYIYVYIYVLCVHSVICIHMYMSARKPFTHIHVLVDVLND